nr:unnamed protein product [Digitaria exilis]
MSFRGFTSKNSTTVGPWGGLGGDPWDDGVNSGVRQIIITHGVAIDSIQIEYDQRGGAVWSEKHGTASGNSKTDQLILDYPQEVLTSISGCYGAVGNSVVLRSLIFESSCSKYGPFGTEQGTSFSLPVSSGKIVGFHGRSGSSIHSIGCHLNKEISTKLSKNAPSALRSITRSYDSNGHRYSDGSAGYDMVLAVKDRADNYSVLTSNLPKEQYPRPQMNKVITYGVVKEPIPIGPGPWGGDGGKPWDDGVYTGVKQIYITRTDFIGSIQIEYDRSGQSVWSTKHGNGGQITHRIKLDYPHEVLTCIYGYFNTCVEEGARVLRSITLVSSRGKYGPFGDEIGSYFTSATTQGKVVGFHGRSSLYLDAIGVHMQHWLGDVKTTSASNSKYYISKYLF